MTEKRGYSRKEAAEYCCVSVSYLVKHKDDGLGPIYIKIGGKPVYLKEDLDAWLSSFKKPESVLSTLCG